MPKISQQKIDNLFSGRLFLSEASLSAYREKGYLEYHLLYESRRIPDKYEGATLYLDPKYPRGFRIHFESAGGYDVYLPFRAIDSILLTNSMGPKKTGLSGLFDKKPNGGGLSFVLEGAERLHTIDKDLPFPNVDYLFFKDWKSDPKSKLLEGLSFHFPQGEAPLGKLENGRIAYLTPGEEKSILRFIAFLGDIKVRGRLRIGEPYAELCF